MTEAEAKTKWCPFARIAATYPQIISPSNGDGLATVNRFGANERGEVTSIEVHCIASACMAWRWIPTWNEHDDKVPSQHGYCGLAQKDFRYD